jgi:hypothetical protein
MASLSNNWLTEDLMDFEYKKYLVLAYLQDVEKHFEEKKLYPDFTELIEHYKNLILLKNNTQLLENQFKKTLKGIDLKNFKLKYDSIINDDSMFELKQIIDFCEPLFSEELGKGKTIFDFAEQQIISDHIGLMPLYKTEGYFLLQPFQSKQISAYFYNFKKVNLLSEEVYGLQCNFYSTYTVSLSKTVDNLKFEIIESNPELPNPAVFLFKAKASLPTDETFLPIAKRLLYKKLVA